MRAIAIDGPAGAGKSTIARGVAKRLGFLYVDTGAMYRAVALQAARANIGLHDPEKLGTVARGCRLEFDDTGRRIFLNGEDVSRQIRTPEITRDVPLAAKSLPVRKELIRRQQELAGERAVVMEGRDITTVVLKDARWKFFLMATVEERAQRRLEELRERGHEVDFETLLQEIDTRDESDRQVGALRKAEELARKPDSDIELLDTTEMSPEEVIEHIIQVVEAG